jgi:hypothetical protein
MATKRLPRPRDPIALAKLIGDIATGQVVDAVDDGKNAAAVARGKMGGALGGRSRAAKLTKEGRISDFKEKYARRMTPGYPTAWPKWIGWARHLES